MGLVTTDAHPFPTDLEIAGAATLRPMDEIATALGLSPDDIEHHGRDLAKVDLARFDLAALAASEEPRGTFVVVTAVTPTPLGEGKTTVCVGLAQGLRRLGSNAVVTLRQPSMGPTFGIKGGAAGGDVGLLQLDVQGGRQVLGQGPGAAAGEVARLSGNDVDLAAHHAVQGVLVADVQVLHVRHVAHVGDDADAATADVFGAIFQYPDTNGVINDYRAVTEALHAKGALVIAAVDLLALTVIEAPGAWGADIAVGTTQRFGIPMEKTVINLDRYGNTSSAGSIIAFHLFNQDLPSGARGVLCSFGAGYSIGSLLLQRRSRQNRYLTHRPYGEEPA